MARTPVVMSALLHTRLPRVRRRAVAAGAFLALVYVVLCATHQLGLTSYRIDLDVYRIGGSAWWAGGDLYGHLPVTTAGLGLPFTYPPIAAVLFSPLAAVPFWVASLAMTLASLAALAVVLRLVVESTGTQRLPWVARQLSGSRLVVALLVIAVPLEPIRETLGFGQVNLLLLGLVVADCLVDRPWWPRGALVGLAAAVKLTPAVLVLFLFLHFGRRAALTALASAVGVTAAGFALALHDSVRYWTSVLFDTDRIGGIAYAGNQSVEAVLARLGLAGHLRAALWALVGTVVVAVAVVSVRRALAAGRPALALCLNGLAGLLVSPVSWSHHWVWLVPLVVALLTAGYVERDRALVRLGFTGLVLAATSPQWWFPHAQDAERHWNPVEQVVGSSYVLYALVVLALVARNRSTGAVDPRDFQGWPPRPQLRAHGSGSTPSAGDGGAPP